MLIGWLRQAISEECSDDLLGNSSTSSPPNGFISPRTAPLKKRRVFNLDSTEDIPSPKDDSKDLLLDDDIKEQVFKIDSNDLVLEDKESKSWHTIESNEDSNIATNFKIETDSQQYIEHVPTSDIVDETKSIEKIEKIEKIETMEIDKLEPIESDEEDMDLNQDECEDVRIKTEIDGNQEQFSHEIKVEENNENICSTSHEDDTEKPCTSFEIDQTTFDAKDLNELKDFVEAENLPLTVLPKDEIEDIQKKLLSFHSENLIILQTRNKKRISRATTPIFNEETSTSSHSTKECNVSGNEYVKNHRKSSLDEQEMKRQPTNNSQIMEDNDSNQSSGAQSQNSNTLNQSSFPPYIGNNPIRNDTPQLYSITSTQQR